MAYGKQSHLVPLKSNSSPKRSSRSLRLAQPACPYLEAVVSPTTKFEDAGLLVEGKILDIDLARALVNGGGFPFDEALVVDGGLGG